MLQLTLAQMRRSLGRLTAAGLAVALGTAFVAATLLAGNAMTRTTFDAVASQFGDADLVVSGTLDEAALARIVASPVVASAQPSAGLSAMLTGPGGTSWTQAQPVAADPRLASAELTKGHWPEANNEIALPSVLADILKVDVGDTVDATTPFHDDTATSGPDDRLTVVGLTSVPTTLLSEGGASVVSPELWHTWFTESNGTVQYDTVAIALKDGVRTSQAINEVSAAAGPDATVQTRDEKAAARASELSGSTWVLTGIVLGFAAIALLVASMVITNTFQVLVAQRTRTLALLRCVGADRRQLRRSVLTEAALLGLAASALGLAAGIGLIQLALTLLAASSDVPVPASVDVSWQAVAIPLLVGTGVTVLASLAPAQAATRVSPLAALRPAAAGARAARAQVVTSIILVTVGAIALAVGWFYAPDNMPAALAVGMLGGAISFVGVVVGAIAWVPGLLARMGRVVGPSAAAHLATANAVRNPRRVAVTSSALFIGVTLVAMMSTGAASVTRAFNTELSNVYPVDVMVTTVPQDPTSPVALPAELITAVTSVDGVAEHALVSTTQAVTFDHANSVLSTSTFAVEPTTAGQVLSSATMRDALHDGVVLFTASDAESLGVDVGDTVGATGPDGSVDLEVASVDSTMALMTRATMAELNSTTSLSELWLRISDEADQTVVATRVQNVVAEHADIPIQVVGLGVEKAMIEKVIETLLLIVIGLLAVAVVIAVVGVANTLSLSVLERRRESAMLRAIGLTRGQLRASLALEGVLVALVGAAMGALLGMAYGWIGAHILLVELVTVELVVPWRDLTLVMFVAVVAGLLASVLPARTATRTSPVAALVDD